MERALAPPGTRELWPGAAGPPVPGLKKAATTVTHSPFPYMDRDGKAAAGKVADGAAHFSWRRTLTFFVCVAGIIFALSQARGVISTPKTALPQPYHAMGFSLWFLLSLVFFVLGWKQVDPSLGMDSLAQAKRGPDDDWVINLADCTGLDPSLAESESVGSPVKASHSGVWLVNFMLALLISCVLVRSCAQCTLDSAAQ
eukprot:g13253.t1